MFNVISNNIFSFLTLCEFTHLLYFVDSPNSPGPSGEVGVKIIY